MGRPLIDIQGQRFGRLVAWRYDHHAKQWLCRCDCGTASLKTTTALRGGEHVSCGCYRRTRPAHNRTHGRTLTTEYRTWRAMKRRCLNPRASQYAYYGGRGITICDRWSESFEAFLTDMGMKPTPSHSLDRIDNEAGYAPDNCRWASRSEQVRNRRRLP